MTAEAAMNSPRAAGPNSTRPGKHRVPAGATIVTRSRALRPGRRTMVQAAEPFGAGVGLVYLTLQRGRHQCGTWLTDDQVLELATLLTDTGPTADVTVVYDVTLTSDDPDRVLVRLCCRIRDGRAALRIHHAETAIEIGLTARRRATLAAGLARLAARRPPCSTAQRDTGRTVNTATAPIDSAT
jgi:hypothetical protein